MIRRTDKGVDIALDRHGSRAIQIDLFKQLFPLRCQPDADRLFIGRIERILCAAKYLLFKQVLILFRNRHVIRQHKDGLDLGKSYRVIFLIRIAKNVIEELIPRRRNRKERNVFQHLFVCKAKRDRDTLADRAHQGSIYLAMYDFFALGLGLL